jgi:hypothetical protein
VRKVIVYSPKVVNGVLTISYVRWAVAAQAVPNPSLVSAVPLSTSVPFGVTPAELSALRTGAIVETTGSVQVPVSNSSPAAITSSIAAIVAAVQALVPGATGLSAAGIMGMLCGASSDGATWFNPSLSSVTAASAVQSLKTA